MNRLFEALSDALEAHRSSLTAPAPRVVNQLGLHSVATPLPTPVREPEVEQLRPEPTPADIAPALEAPPVPEPQAETTQLPFDAASTEVFPAPQIPVEAEPQPAENEQLFSDADAARDFSPAVEALSSFVELLEIGKLPFEIAPPADGAATADVLPWPVPQRETQQLFPETAPEVTAADAEDRLPLARQPDSVKVWDESASTDGDTPSEPLSWPVLQLEHDLLTPDAPDSDIIPAAEILPWPEVELEPEPLSLEAASTEAPPVVEAQIPTLNSESYQASLDVASSSTPATVEASEGTEQQPEAAQLAMAAAASGTAQDAEIPSWSVLRPESEQFFVQAMPEDASPDFETSTGPGSRTDPEQFFEEAAHALRIVPEPVQQPEPEQPSHVPDSMNFTPVLETSFEPIQQLESAPAVPVAVRIINLVEAFEAPSDSVQQVESEQFLSEAAPASISAVPEGVEFTQQLETEQISPEAAPADASPIVETLPEAPQLLEPEQNSVEAASADASPVVEALPEAPQLPEPEQDPVEAAPADVSPVVETLPEAPQLQEREFSPVEAAPVPEPERAKPSPEPIRAKAAASLEMPPLSPFLPKLTSRTAPSVVIPGLFAQGGAVSKVPQPTLVDSLPTRAVGINVPAESRLVALTDPNSLGAEKFRALVTRLEHLHKTTELKCFQVTSSVIHEGKTLVSGNVAVTLAKYSGAKTLLIEGDLHRPTLATIFGLNNMRGLSHWWASQDQDLAPYVYRLDDLPLWFLPAGIPSDRPSDILRSARFVKAFSQMASRYEWVVVDSTPMLPIIDVNLWSRLVDGTLLVIREGVTPVKALKQGLRALDHPKLIGVVLNDASATHETKYDGQYYGSPKRKPSAPAKNKLTG